MAKILVVDDDVHNIILLQKLLTHESYSVVTAINGLEALETVAREDPDLVLLDIMMPGLDGFAVTRRLRADARFQSLPIIVVSAKGQTQDITTGLDAGANDYLTKPIILEELLARVRTQLRLKEAQDRLTRANEDLQRLSDLKSRLVTVVSHELRTPLTSIRGALDLVIKRAQAELPEKHLQLLDISVRNTDRLIRLINDVLDFARLEQAGLDLRPRLFELKPVVARAVEEVTAVVEPAQIRILEEVPDGLPRALGDPERIHQVVLNLLSNAIKFSPSGAEVRIRARVEDERLLRVEVTDQGGGIPPEHQVKLFQPFQQFGRPTQKLGGGTGLGLTISREIVNRHGGAIGVISASGEGSTFWFTIPRGADGAKQGA